MKEFFEMSDAVKEWEHQIVAKSTSSNHASSSLTVMVEAVKVMSNFRSLNLRRVITLIVGIAGYFVSVLAFVGLTVFILIPPYIPETTGWIVPLAFLAMLFIPKVTNLLRKLVNQEQFVWGRMFVLIAIFICIVNIQPLYSRAQFSSLSPVEKVEAKRHSEAREESARQSKKMLEEQQDIANAEAARKKSEADDAEVENKSQKKFYADLGAPKLLYKCKNSPFVVAIGAKIGTFNRLLADANQKCGQGNVEILDSDK